MSNLAINEVEFNGSQLMAAQDNETQKIYVGVSWVCNGLRLSKSQKDTQVQNIQTDIVIKQGCLKLQAGVFDPNNETLALELEYLPLWLAKISITPTMQKTNPELVERLVEYQLKAKDVLADAFIDNKFRNKDLPFDFNFMKTIMENMVTANQQLSTMANKAIKGQNKLIDFMEYLKPIMQNHIQNQSEPPTLTKKQTVKPSTASMNDTYKLKNWRTKIKELITSISKKSHIKGDKRMGRIYNICFEEFEKQAEITFEEEIKSLKMLDGKKDFKKMDVIIQSQDRMKMFEKIVKNYGQIS